VKTIDEQAKDFSKFDSTIDIGTDLGSYRQGLFEGYIAGYQAAKDQIADADKVMFCVYCNDTHKGDCAVGKGKNHSAFGFSEIVVKIESGWISVKDRLPEDKESVIYWHDLHGTNIGHYDSTFPKPNYHWWSYNYGDHADFRVHWWMPLPKIPEAPKEEYQFTGRDVPIFEKPKEQS
jgi:hypothetical protein